MVENRAHRSSRSPSPREPQQHPTREQPESERKELTSNLGRLSAQCHAQTDLATALRDGVAQYAIGSNGRKQQRNRGEESGQQRGGAAGGQAVGNARLHRLNVVYRQVRVDLTNYPLEGRFEGLRRKGCPDSDKDIVISAKGVGIINRALRCIICEASLLHVANHADNRERLRIATLVGPKEQVFAQGVAIRKIVAGEILVHRADALRAS